VSGTALVTGVTGQDGSYLAEQLLAEGWRVVGTVRALPHGPGCLPPAAAARVELVALDLLDPAAIAEALRRHRPDEVYNLAAHSSGEGMWDDAPAIGALNGLAVAHLLEAIRRSGAPIRFCQASSSELFGEPAESPQTEGTPFRPRSPYGAAKLYAHTLVGIYRRRHGLFACSAILFNHESPRRGPGFVTRKVTRAAARIKLGLERELRLGNLEARRDWGFAGDAVRAMRLMLRAERADDYVVATGEPHAVRDLCACAFSHLGLDWRAHVREDPGAFRPGEALPLVGDAGRARRVLGWRPAVGFEELVRGMVDADLEALRAVR
jgi:GDPmannose 4,6-dehydratase